MVKGNDFHLIPSRTSAVPRLPFLPEASPLALRSLEDAVHEGRLHVPVEGTRVEPVLE